MTGAMTRTVLVVEDTDLCRETLEIALDGLPGVKVFAVPTAEAALEYVASQELCALVTDLHLPDMSGFELIQALRSRSEYADLPIVVTSGDSDPHTQINLAQLGASAYFAKPYSPSELRGILEQLIEPAS
jgi:DNA-binding response OmpR family regulator